MNKEHRERKSSERQTKSILKPVTELPQVIKLAKCTKDEDQASELGHGQDQDKHIGEAGLVMR